MGAPEVHEAIRDEEVPAVGALLGPAAIEVVAEGVTEEGGSVRAVRPIQVSYHPGDRITVTYEADIDWPEGYSSEDLVVALARPEGPPDGSVPVERDDTTIGVWRLPHDPRLPGLVSASDPAFVRSLLDEVGAPPGAVELAQRSYWPRMRAVIEVSKVASRHQLVFRPGEGIAPKPPKQLTFLNVVRPEDCEELVRLHEQLAPRLPVPVCLHSVEELGILVLEAKPGDTLWACVQDEIEPVPGPDVLVTLLDRLAELQLDGERKDTTGEVAQRSARLLRAVLPEEAGRIDRFMERLGEDSDEALITTHGDFHEVQVLIDQGGISALLDIDDVGPGQRIDDLAMMAGRFWSFGPFEPYGREQIEGYALELLRAFGELVDPVELHRRVAGVLFARATSPFRGQDQGWPSIAKRAIGLAEDWLERPVTT
jgi:hypothetical protein